MLRLHAVETADLLAVMDSTHLTAVRTGLAGALAAHVFARPDADTGAVVGAGLQGTYQLRSLAALRPLRRAWAYDIVPGRRAAFAQAMTDELRVELRVPIDVTGSVAAAVREADVAAEVILAGLFVCDDRALAVEMGTRRSRAGS